MPEMVRAAQKVFKQHEMKLRDIDSEGGVVETEWMVIDGKYGIVESWRAEVSDKDLRLTMRCEQLRDDGKRPCVVDPGRTARFDQLERKLRAEMEQDANRRAGRNPDRFKHMPYSRRYDGTE
jgi:hypothetical protein